MYLGYNTNGLAHHRLEDAIRLLSEAGYRGIAITIDHGALAPGSETLAADLERVKIQLAEHRMRCVIETGARYLLDYRRKHHPTLISASAEDRQRRIDFIEHAIDVARALSADCVSLWSGAMNDTVSPVEYMRRLVDGLNILAATAQAKGVVLAFEPEPGMFIDTMTRFDELMQFIASPNIALTLDVGHLHCLGETPIEDYIAKYAHLFKNIHIEDMRRGVHEHLPFGEGEMNIPSIVDALAKSGYQGGVFVELSRHSHVGSETARRAYEYLKPLADWKT
jgi:L-ribulose-5-phosphate 3-epimerase